MYVSIDWDFFIYNGQQDKYARGTKVPGWQLFDWGHNEGHGAFLQDVLWITRVCGAAAGGIDLMTLASVETAGLSIDEFLDVLLKRYEIAGDCVGAYGDSHLQAYQRLTGAEALLMFDAHHDLGYGPRGDTIDCGSWLGQWLVNDPRRRATIVHPPWLNYRKWREDVERASYYPNVQHQVSVYSWGQWRETQFRRRPTITKIHLCRSSAWTPPWCDKQFAELRKRLDCTINLDRRKNMAKTANDAGKRRSTQSIYAALESGKSDRMSAVAEKGISGIADSLGADKMGAGG